MTLKMMLAAASLLLVTPALAEDPIKIGLSGPFTGGSSSMGVSMRDGVKLAVEEINKAGGVLGRPIQLVERDDEAKNEVGVQIAQELDQQGAGRRHARLHQHRRRAGRAALLPGGRDPGAQQRRHGLGHHQAVHGAGPQGELRLPQLRQRHDPERDDRR